MSDKEEKKIQKVKECFKYILKDFDQSESNEEGERPQYIGYDVPKTLRIEPYIVFIIFVYLKQYKFAGKWEKIAWSFGLEYKGVPLVYSHQKFGFRVSVCNKSGNGKSVAKEALEQIHKAVPLAEKLIEPLIHSKLDSGQVSVPNNYKELKERYQFFRKKAEHYFKKVDSKHKDTQLIWMAFHDSILKATNYSIAMLDAYFSLLEHTLVLLKPFANHEFTKDLSDFIGSKWATKYKKIYNIEKEKKAKIFLERLTEIKEKYRNVYAHGNFQKEGGSFHIHMEHLGALPFQLTKSDQSLVFNSSSIYPNYYNDICKQLDDFDSFLESGKTKFGMMYIETGFPVAFDDASISLYHACMISEEKFEEFLHYNRGMEIDNAMNMDW